jgi:hypothetical protein
MLEKSRLDAIAMSLGTDFRASLSQGSIADSTDEWSVTTNTVCVL